MAQNDHMVIKLTSSMSEKLKFICWHFTKCQKEEERLGSDYREGTKLAPRWGNRSKGEEFLASWTKVRSLATVFSTEQPSLTLRNLLTLFLRPTQRAWRKLFPVSCQGVSALVLDFRGYHGSCTARLWCGCPRSPGGVFSSRWVEAGVENGVLPHLMSLLLPSGATGLFPIKKSMWHEQTGG